MTTAYEMGWTELFSDIAQKEGWDIFDSDHGPEIERCDEAGIFASDQEAVDYVRSKAERGYVMYRIARDIDAATQMDVLVRAATQRKRKRLFLLLWEDCNRQCSYCCNKQNDIENVPVCTDVSGYDSIIFTGGEPMLCPDRLRAAIEHVAFNTSEQTKLYMYTAMTSRPDDLISVIDKHLDGCTITLHTQSDVNLFSYLYGEGFSIGLWERKSMRLKVMAGIELYPQAVDGFEVIGPVTPLSNCPMPKNADFLRYDPIKLRSSTVRWRNDMLHYVLYKCVDKPQWLSDEDIAGMYMIASGALPAKAQASIAAHYRSSNGKIITYEEQ